MEKLPFITIIYSDKIKGVILWKLKFVINVKKNLM